MTFTGRIRLYLVLIAVIPPLLILGAVWYESNAYNIRWKNSTVQQQLQTISFVLAQREGVILRLMDETLRSYGWPILGIPLNRRHKFAPPPASVGPSLDFLELVRRDGTVVWSRGRPELVGDQMSLPKEWSQKYSPMVYRIEIDQSGPHASTAMWCDIDSILRLYGGQYLDSDFLSFLTTLSDATIVLQYVDPDKPDADLSRMKRKELYERDGDMTTLLAGGPDDGYYLTAFFAPENRLPQFLTLYIVAIVVGVVAVLLAILLAWSLARRADLELNNLLAATERVARGDLQTPLFAYDSGEFSKLADGLSDMISKLRQSQERLSATERIAAWQVMGRKIAHEIKNPLTPISISTDDLRRSYSEGRTDFGNTLAECTTTIKNEIARMTRLLDQFVAFARMPAPSPVAVKLHSIVDDIRLLFQSEVSAGRLVVASDSTRKTLWVDPEQIKQLMINLIKNGEEAGGGLVTVQISDAEQSIWITVEDSGPGFSQEKLANPFEPYVSTKKDGSGLGLVICQRIAIDHGGTIELYNRPEGGAGVRVTLPQA